MQETDLHIKIQVRYSISYQGRDFICILSVTQKCMRVVEFSAMSKQKLFHFCNMKRNPIRIQIQENKHVTDIHIC